jgi:precorrin-6B methylase 2
MTPASFLGLLGLVLSLTLAGADASAQPAASTYQPTPGQPGKDVVWQPTPQALVEKMLDMAKVTPEDFVMDLGSGDGRTVIAAARRGIRALGVEYDPDMVELSKRSAEQAGVADRAQFVQADLFETDLSRATVVTMFLLPDINLKLRPNILALRPGTRIVSNTFTMGEWEADETATLDASAGCDQSSWCTALLWIVPAKVAGKHRTAQGELTLEQTFQRVSGTLRSKGKAIPVHGRVLGSEVIINAGGRELRGKVDGTKLRLD